MDPINYSAAFTDVQSPVTAFTQGLQGGAAFRQVRLEQDQLEAAAAQKKQMQLDLQALSTNPTPQAIARASLKYPQLSEQFKRSFDALSDVQKQSKLEAAGPVHAAVLAGQYGIAAKQLRQQADAQQNSGSEQEAQQTRAMADLIEQHPESAKITTGLLLSSALGPEKYAEAFAKFGAESRAQELQPSAVREAGAKADTAVAGVDSAKAKAISDGVDAKYADQTALLKLEGIRTDNQYKRDQTKIAYLNAQIAREGNAIQKQKLQIDLQKAVTERDEKVRGKVADAESAASSIDNMLNTVDRILKNPSLDSVIGSIQGRMPALLNDEAADAIANIETLGSQVFLSQIPSMKGTGNLSEKEGDKLQTSLQNLGRVQSRAQFEANLREAQRLGMKARGNISTRYGVKLGAPDTPAAAKPQASALPSGWTVTER